ncbi:ATP-dependent helicase [Ruicaihuangia caeni]|uniref:ATP-dependent helicase n=1 Tax=Ruicaihuangia caeni TaxID=3042517 RepID=UPI00338E361C
MTSARLTSADDVLRGLDDEQRLAARALLGPVCVLAGAGTGKTRAITHRIAYGVASGVYSPSRVMALTFTNRAAGELRSRLRALGATGVAARTFHSGALAQLNYFWPQFIGGSMPRIIDSKARLLAHAADSVNIRIDTAALRDIAGEIEWRKVRRMPMADYEGVLASRPVSAHLATQTVLDLHLAYERLKDERRLMDFEDVLLVTSGLLESEPRALAHVHEQYRFFVVDEYQDVSPLQHDLLQLWLGDRDDVCVVGDASQTIYSFAGASSDYLLGFGSRYPDATIVKLERNYRSTPAIIEAANRLMRGRPGALELHPAERAAQAASSGSSDLEIDEFRNDHAEAHAIAARITALIEAGERADAIAVLMRTNAQSAVIESALAAAGISVRTHGSTRFFDLPEVKRAVLELRGYALSRPAGPLFKHVSDVLRPLGWSQHPPEEPGAARDRWEALNAIMGLADDAPEGTTLDDFVADLLERQAAQHEPGLAAVTLATLHSAKGLEWDHVYLVGAAEGLLPISHARDERGVEEERRLFYVGVTRARRSLRISWARDGQHRSGSRSPSRFLQDLRSRIPDAALSDAR